MNPFISLSIMSLSKCVSHPTLWSYSIKRRSIIDGKETRAEMKAGYERWLASSGISTSCIPSPTYAAIPIARYCDGSIYNVNISYELNVKLVRKVQNVCFLKKNFQKENEAKATIVAPESKDQRNFRILSDTTYLWEEQTHKPSAEQLCWFFFAKEMNVRNHRTFSPPCLHVI
jgi:hypothetical protein